MQRIHHTLLAAVDPDTMAADLPILRHALTRARLLEPCHVHVVGVASTARKSEGQAIEKAIRRHALEAFADVAQDDTTAPELWLHVMYGDPASEIILLADAVAADEILIGNSTSGRHAVAISLLERAPCSLDVIRPREAESRYTCLECERIRAESDGYQLFCSGHASQRPMTQLISSSGSLRPTTFG